MVCALRTAHVCVWGGMGECLSCLEKCHLFPFLSFLLTPEKDFRLYLSPQATKPWSMRTQARKWSQPLCSVLWGEGGGLLCSPLSSPSDLSFLSEKLHVGLSGGQGMDGMLLGGHLAQDFQARLVLGSLWGPYHKPSCPCP